MDYNPVGWFEIYVADMARAKAFYEAVLDIELKPLPEPPGIDMDMEMRTFPGDPTRAGATGALVRMDGVPQGIAGTIVYFGCDDCGKRAERAVTAGGRIHTPRMSIGPYGFIALCHDSEGNVFGLHSMS